MGKRFALLVVVAAALTAAPNRARGQVFPSHKMTQAFHRLLDSLASKGGGAFVSDCYGPKDGDMAILVVPLGTDQGTVTLFTNHSMYNGAGIRLRGGKVGITEGGGGEWSLRKLQVISDRLATLKFRLLFGNQLRNAADQKPSDACPSF